MILATQAGGSDREIFLDIKHGVEAKNYEDVRKILRLCPLLMHIYVNSFQWPTFSIY